MIIDSFTYTLRYNFFNIRRSCHSKGWWRCWMRKLCICQLVLILSLMLARPKGFEHIQNYWDKHSPSQHLHSSHSSCSTTRWDDNQSDHWHWHSVDSVSSTAPVPIYYSVTVLFHKLGSFEMYFDVFKILCFILKCQCHICFLHSFQGHL